MAFVNEYVSEEDIKKYNLEEDWIRRNPQYLQQGRPPSSPLKWTIDRDRNIYFMVVGGGGREDYDLGMQCIINWQATVLEISLAQADGCSKSFTEVPFKIIWELKHIKPSQLDTISH